MSEKSLEVDDSRAAGLFTMPLVSSSLEELVSMLLPPRLHRLITKSKAEASRQR